jgi:hypothetical protein
MNYKGHASFDHEIERMKDAEGNLYTDSEDAPDGSAYAVINLKITGFSYFAKGRTFGLPEDCYPDEGCTEIHSIIGPDGKDWESVLTESEKNAIEEQIADNVINNCEEDYDDSDPPSNDFDDSYLDYSSSTEDY